MSLSESLYAPSKPNPIGLLVALVTVGLLDAAATAAFLTSSPILLLALVSLSPFSTPSVALPDAEVAPEAALFCSSFPLVSEEGSAPFDSTVSGAELVLQVGSVLFKLAVVTVDDTNGSVLFFLTATSPFSFCFEDKPPMLFCQTFWSFCLNSSALGA